MDVTVVSTTTLVLNDDEVEALCLSLRLGTQSDALSAEQAKVAQRMLDGIDPSDY